MAEHQVLPDASDLVARRLSGGTQNDVFELCSGSDHIVLRRAPTAGRADRYRAIVREIRLLRALAGSDVPHARLLAADVSEAGLLGGPFYVTQFVDGWNPMGAGVWPAPFDRDLDSRRGLAFELVGGAARLANVDWRARGLDDFGHPDNFHERQVDRWLTYLSAFQFREIPQLDVAADWLRRHRPVTYRPGVMHGDYQCANVIFAPGARAELAAIIDWEMGTVGDPLLDLGWALLAWPPEADDMVETRYVDYTGMPPREELLAHYESISGRPTKDIDYYVILARFKLAIVLEASVARRGQGQADARTDMFGPIVLELARKAAELSRSTAHTSS
jgi:aminoglycoside phosphotransferase (APT) family kinase protein